MIFLCFTLFLIKMFRANSGWKISEIISKNTLNGDGIEITGKFLYSKSFYRMENHREMKFVQLSSISGSKTFLGWLLLVAV